MIQQQFVQSSIERIKNDTNVLGLAVAGSFITNEVDEFSDVDLVLITKEKIAPDGSKMIAFAKTLGDFISGFTGEHIGDRRVLICLYDNPLLHVDIKFLISEEFQFRVEDPVVVFERDQHLTKIIEATTSSWPALDYQWLEDRFWTWIHYATLKIGRGEYFEALDFLSAIRGMVLGPLLQIKNGKLPRGVRKVEVNFLESDLRALSNTVAHYDRKSIIIAVSKIIELYRSLRMELFPKSVIYQKLAEQKAFEYFTITARKK